jgi:[ribosomal protein S5]-alanine N-acetyltransferase
VHKYLGNNPVKTMEQSRDNLKYIHQQYADNGIGRWAVIDKITNDFLGWSGLKYEEELRSEFSYYDLGYRFKKQYWGQGFATEAAVASLQYGFETLKLEQICAAAHVENIRSNKILQKVGLRFKETFEYQDALCNWYRLDRLEWLDEADRTVIR